MKHPTADVATCRGVYLSDCRCRVEFTVARGMLFPPCPKCQQHVTWYFQRSVWADRPIPPPMPPRP